MSRAHASGYSHYEPELQLARTKLHSSVTSCRKTSLHSRACVYRRMSVGQVATWEGAGCRGGPWSCIGVNSKDLVNGQQLSLGVRRLRADQLPARVACGKGEERAQDRKQLPRFSRAFS